MGIRDRIRDLGLRAAEGALKRAEATVDRVFAEPQPAAPESVTQGPDVYIPTPIPETVLNTRHIELLQSEEFAKASRPQLPELGPDEDPKSLFWDPYMLIEQMGFREKPTAVTYGTLRQMTFKMPVIEAILTQRLNQVSAFCSPRQDQYSMGFQVRLRDQKKRPSRKVQAELERVESWIMHTGVDYDIDRDDFEGFTRKLLWDSLAYDQANAEVVPGKDGKPSAWYAIDAASIRLADAPRRKAKDPVKAVQIYDASVIAEYSPEELIFGIRNPRTDLKTYGYGCAELERLVTTITSLLWAWNYNSNAFSQGSLQKGLLNLKGQVNQKQLRAFRRHWYQSLAGAANAWRTPILNAPEGVEWTKMQDSNKDMEFNAWMDFLIKVACAMYSMDPSEIGFIYGATGRQRPMFEGNNKARLIESRDRGLKPLLRVYQGWLNRWIIWPYEEDFEFVFMGLNAATPEELAKINKERVQTVITVNELRAEQDKDPLPGGDIILNPVYMQNLQMQQQAEMMAQQQEMGGMDPTAAGGTNGTDQAAAASDEDSDRLAFFDALDDYDDEATKSLAKSVANEILFELELEDEEEEEPAPAPKKPPPRAVLRHSRMHRDLR